MDGKVSIVRYTTVNSMVTRSDVVPYGKRPVVDGDIWPNWYELIATMCRAMCSRFIKPPGKRGDRSK